MSTEKGDRGAAGLLAAGVPIPLVGVTVEAELQDFAVRTVLTQRYRNDETRPIEAVYLFPLDEGAAVAGFEALIGDLHVVGEVKGRDEAFETYDDALAAGHGAYLLDQERPDVFTASVGNVPPGAEVVVRITTVAELVLDGEELVGAKQNRIANLTILVPAESRLNLPVSCVEAGRWHHRGLHAKTSKRAFYASGRALKARAVSESYRRMQRPVSDQREIWDDIALKSSRLRAHSETAEMGAIYERASLDLAGVRMRLDARPGQRGAIFTAGPALLGLDLFDSPETWRKLLLKLSASYGLDAIDRASLGAPPADIPDGFDAGAVLAHVKLLHAEGYPAVGLGQDVRLSGPQLAGGALVVDGLLVHLGVFGAPVAA